MKINLAEINQAKAELVKENILDLLKVLKERDIRIIRLRYGLDDGRIRTLEEVGKEVGLTRERVLQIEEKALRKVRLYHSTASFKKSPILL